MSPIDTNLAQLKQYALTINAYEFNSDPNKVSLFTENSTFFIFYLKNNHFKLKLYWTA